MFDPRVIRFVQMYENTSLRTRVMQNQTIQIHRDVSLLRDLHHHAYLKVATIVIQGKLSLRWGGNVKVQ